MDILLPEGTELYGFERALQDTLERADLPGYALMNFTYVEAFRGQRHEIDAVLLLEPGRFFCLEAKGYRGQWTGSANEKWLSGNQEIQAVRGNPYKQVQKYSLTIKNKLVENVFKGIPVWVNSLIVAPDDAKFNIEGAVFDKIVPNAIAICHLSQIENVVGSRYGNQKVTAKVKELGDLLKIASELTGISVENLRKLIVTKRHQPLSKSANISEFRSDLSLNKAKKIPIKKHKNHLNSDKKPPILVTKKWRSENLKSGKKSNIKFFVKAVILIVGIGGLVAFGTRYYPWNEKPCSNAEEIRVAGECYKDISKTPLVIGMLTSYKNYSLLRDYLQQELGSQVADVAIEGGSSITYQDAQNNIAKKNWDIVFALSPINGMRAKDNGYQWVARMFPDYPATYQSALFVRKDSPIQSISDITSDTKIALGDFSSASSFYIPSYDLYGKSMTVMAGNRSGKIIELVASGEADVGAAVYSRVQDDRRFRVIQVSREIPGTGVYLSPNLPPTVAEKIAKILMDAPPEIKEEANYGADDEPDYEVLRLITLRVDEILSCADFSRNPVQFFCLETPEGIVGTIRGFKREDNESVRLRLERENGETCDLVTSLQTLSSVPDGTSPGVLNRRRVSAIGVEPQQVDGSCEMRILNPSQLKVLSDDE